LKYNINSKIQHLPYSSKFCSSSTIELDLQHKAPNQTSKVCLVHFFSFIFFTQLLLLIHRKILSDLHLEQKEDTKIFVDNQVVIAISHNPVFHGKTKHFNMKLFFVREVQKDSVVTLIYCKTEEKIADIFTKSLVASKFEDLRTKLGVCNI